MGKIKILSEKMTKMIAAGEVVDRPASIIKELVENSIDAGATALTIEIVNGGQTKIAISDNGCGMNKEDLELSIFPHATSKIENPEDLSSIATLGFRGEALSSICAVSEVSIMSKTAKQEYGYLAKVDDGKITSLTEINCETGTRIEVSNLFYNVPARLKFLRKSKTDEADITDYVEKLMMAYSNISFKYIIDGKTKYNTFGSGLFDNIYTIYGKDISNNLIKIDAKKDNYHLYGYVGKPQIAKSNRNYQTLLVGGRYVKNQMISTAIGYSFENYLMKGKFPFYVLFLDMPLDSLDVNIHPSKLEVKFEKPNFIYGFINEEISKALVLTNYEKSIQLINPSNENVAKFESEPLSKSFGISFNEKTDKKEIVLDANEIIPSKKQDFEKYIHSETTQNTSQDNYADTTTHNSLQMNFDIATDLHNQKPENDKISFSEIKKLEQIQNLKKDSQNEKVEEQKINFDGYQIIGRAFETYIFLQQNNEVFIIDQHAAHERILFDKFMAEIENNQIIKQDLLFPYVFEVKDKDFVKIKEVCPTLLEFGFEIYEFGQNCFKIDCIPLLLQKIDLKSFIDMITADNFFAKKSGELIRNSIATLACKSAVKGGDTLSSTQIDYIVQNIQNGVLLCPHGRPFVIKISKYQLEKWFGRVQ